MHPLRKQRLQFVILIVVAATVAGGLSGLYAWSECQLFLHSIADCCG